MHIFRHAPDVMDENMSVCGQSFVRFIVSFTGAKAYFSSPYIRSNLIKVHIACFSCSECGQSN